jgi:archaemetzincin
MENAAITLISFTHLQREVLEQIAQAVQQEFDHTVIVREGHLDISEFYDPGRRQYNADKLLRLIDAQDQPGTQKTIAIFNVDLFIPILTYIFGQAFLGGKTAIASVFRLRNEQYGIASDENSLIDRLTKEVVHELGHTFGLIHCHNPVCVMRSSTYVEDIDQKEARLCQACRASIKVSLPG